MSIARHHAEWLSLVDQSGPFLSVPVLMRAFPQGLDKPDADLKREMRLAYDEWLQQQHDPAIQTAWIRFVLTQLLEYPDDLIAEGQSLPGGLSALVSEQNETLRPDLAIIHSNGNPSNGKPSLLIQKYRPNQRLESAVAGKHWKASPATRMMELLHATDVPLGLVTNGEQWMLVYAPRNETTGFASWYASLWSEEPATFQAFVSLLSVRRFFGVADSDTLPALLDESAKNQQEVTDQLGLQVRQAVEVLVQAFDRIDQDSGRILLKGMDEKRLYEASLTVMMRLVFLFCAEERKLLPIDEYALYAQSYAVSNLGAQLREVADKHGEEILERSFDAWSRLLAAFRIVYAGVDHESMRLPPYGGNLFNPDRFPFLEGRPPHGTWRDTPAEPLRIDNRTVLHLLEALQWLVVKIPGGGPRERRRLSFRALDIEQIGHVYEGLLDHTAVRATDSILGLSGGKGKEPEIALSKLEQLRDKGEDDLVEFLTKETGRSEKALLKAVSEPVMIDEAKLRVACRNDTNLMKRVLPFVSLIRDDTFGYPVIIAEGSVYVTAGTDRRSSGTHYTPRSLTEPIVQHTLEPLVYEGPAEGVPKDKWRLKTAREILDLNVCDMAMGSGAFLVQSCRYLSERLLEAWETAEKELGGSIQITPEGERSKGVPEERLVPTDPDERSAIAMRIVAERCLYGVDKNPLAVEMAKLSLWLITLSKGKPFTFLDHALKCGDSLVGADAKMFLDWARGGTKEQVTIFDEKLKKLLDDARLKRKELESFEVKDVRDAERKSDLLDEAEMAMQWVKQGCNLLIGTLLSDRSAAEKRTQLNKLLIGYLKDLTVPGPEAVEAIKLADNERAFHWPFEFPEVFERGGFDAFIGNPPFMGGQRITGNLGTYYREYIVIELAGGKRGTADLCVFFFIRGYQLIKHRGILGMLATNTISQGDSREVGLEQICNTNGAILRAIPTQKWPGQINLQVSVVWIGKGDWNYKRTLDDASVDNITPYLTESGSEFEKPLKLSESATLAFIGSYILGLGFILTPDERHKLVNGNSHNEDVIFPFINGEEINADPGRSQPRFAINFFDWPLDRSQSGSWKDASAQQRRQWLRTGRVPSDYPDPVAADYPDCLNIVQTRVKPVRDKVTYSKSAREQWWLYERLRKEMYAATSGMTRIIVCSLISKYTAVEFVQLPAVCSHNTVVFARDDFAHFAFLQSTVNAIWVSENMSTFGKTQIYAVGDCVETLVLPPRINTMSTIGEEYYVARRKLMVSGGLGLTSFYNCVHDPENKDQGMSYIRELQCEVDAVVCSLYGWSDLQLNHGFYKTRHGVRYTLCDEARNAIFVRLLELNHHQYQDECEQGLHDKKSNKTKNKRVGKRKKGHGNAELPL
ncbi:conserved hypothetical protein [Candidatus Zixiibacteriota bacterium]|nr:conserved hypothetical protein [candidate division Zixibacteria bacterium]